MKTSPSPEVRRRSFDYLSVAPISAQIPPKRQAAKRHYGVHPYFTRRAWNVVQAYISTFTQPGDTVCDPFGGSGVTAVEALVLGRKAIHVDLSPLANFITKNTAVAPVSIEGLERAFEHLKKKCRRDIKALYGLSAAAVERKKIEYWYPKDIPLPSNADVKFVHELFTRRSLIALATLRHHIMRLPDAALRDLMLFVFSGTLAKVNRTFVSAEGRAESRGGATIFSVYRYYVPPHPVELDVWEQFEMRFRSLLNGKRETNALIGKHFQPGKTLRIVKASATDLRKHVKSGTVDYIYTDPPYGAHIAYLDLATMWDAWLGFSVSEKDRTLEVIEGGDLRKSKSEYTSLLEASIKEMVRILKYDRWLSMVFAHKDPAYWDTIVKACQAAGLEYVNTAVQPVSVVWSMHKKKNPLKVLAGEMVLNFRKVRNPNTIAIAALGMPAVQLIKNTAEVTIVRNGSATTEEIYSDLVPRLLEAGHLGEIKKDFADLTPLLAQEFDFSKTDHSWHLRPNTKIGHFVPLPERIRFYVIDYLRKMERLGQKASFDEIVFNVMPNLINGEQPTNQSILLVLQQVAHSPDGRHWVRGRRDKQLTMDLDWSATTVGVPELPTVKAKLEHNDAVYRLAKLGLASGFIVHIGRKEQGAEWNGEHLSALSLKEFPRAPRTTDFALKKVEQIDCVYLEASGTPVYAFEVEGTTPMTTALERFMELLRVNPDIAKRLVIVTPRERKKKLDEVLLKSHFVGHPLFLETKVVYLYYDEFLRLYDSFKGKALTSAVIINALDRASSSPSVTAQPSLL